MKLENIKYVVFFNKGFVLTDDKSAGQLEGLELQQEFGYHAEEIYAAKVDFVWEDMEQTAVKVSYGSREVYGVVQESWDGTLFADEILTVDEVQERKTFFANSGSQDDHLVAARMI